MRALLLIVPDEMLLLLIVGGGLAVIVGARRLGFGLVILGVTLAVLPTLLAPFFGMLPEWVLVALMVALVVGVVLSGLRWISCALIGNRATDHMVGALAADVVRATVVGTARAAARMVRLCWRGLRTLLRA